MPNNRPSCIAPVSGNSGRRGTSHGPNEEILSEEFASAAPGQNLCPLSKKNRPPTVDPVDQPAADRDVSVAIHDTTLCVIQDHALPPFLFSRFQKASSVV